MADDTPAPGPPPAGASAILNDAPAETDQLAAFRQNVDAKIAAFTSHPEVAKLLLDKDPHATHELNRLKAWRDVPSGQFPGAAQTEAEVERHQQGWNTFIGASM